MLVDGLLGIQIGTCELVCFTNQLVLVLSTKQEQTKAMKWTPMHLKFSQIGKNMHFSHDIRFEDLQAFHTKVDFHLGLGMCLP